MGWQFEHAKYDAEAEKWLNKEPDEGTVRMAQAYATLAQAAATMYLAEVTNGDEV